MRKKLAILLALALVVTMIVPDVVFAAQGGGLTDQLNQTYDQTKDARTKLGDDQGQQNAFLSQIRDLDQDIAAVAVMVGKLMGQLNVQVAERQETERQLAIVQAEIDKTLVELQAAKKRLSKQQQVLNRRIKGIYEYSKTSSIQVVLNSSSFSDFINRLSFLQFIAAQDTRIINQIKELKTTVEKTEAQLEVQRTSLETKRSALRAQEQQISKLKGRQEAKMAALQSQKVKKKALVDNPEADQIDQWNAQVEAARAAQQASSRGRDRSSSPALPSSGWVWPTGAMDDITSYFGLRIAPMPGASTFHQGVDIGVAEGTPIVAAHSGVVTVAGYYGGYGNFIEIDGGDGISTGYAHQLAFAVSAGQYVQAGQVIGYVGSTGISTDSHLHFEIRVDHESVNPLNFY